jgi:hypothetical protein
MLTTLVALSVLAAAPDVDPEPPLAAPVIKLKSATVEKEQVNLTFEVTNRSGVAVPYTGYMGLPNDSEIAPIYRIQERKEKVWKDKGLGWCGTGRGPVTLPARGKVTFTVGVAERDWDEMKVGLVWFATEERKEPKVAWSEGVTRKAAGLKD